MQINRLFEILYLLLKRGSVTSAELAERFEVSTRTVYRDIELLSGAGIPVYASRGRNGGISLLDRFVLDRSLLSAREQDEILFALQSLQATRAERNGSCFPGSVPFSGARARTGSTWIFPTGGAGRRRGKNSAC